MASALDDDDLALSINPSHTRRGSARSPSEQSTQNDPMQNTSPAQARQPQQAHAPPQNRQSRLGQYNVIKTLGEGSFGKVKLAVHAVSKQKVALKIISRRKLIARDMAGRVEREIQYLQLLRHPHIIKLYTVITTPTEIIMVLEYAGSELFNYLVENGKMVEDKARLFFQQIVCAVEYCHRHKIVHRDLKPENLLLDEHLHVKIADFGLSNIMTDGNFLKTSCGSPNYAAPEVISGKLYAGPEVDVWSCGVILYVLLVGRLPFDDEYIPALFKKIAQGNYHVPQYLSQGAERLIRKMLHVSPVHRITVQEIRQDPWFKKNLPEYLQPPVEEFLDTGVDPSKPIDPRSLAPTKSNEVVDKLHNSVVGKLGKTMGYGREDVQQALAVDEPNAIKDAYLIVRENQIMRETPSLIRDPALQPFLAQSPPVSAPSPIAAVAEAGGHSLPRQGKSSSSPLKNQQQQQQTTRERRRESINTPGSATRGLDDSNIAVLPSSLPDYHRAFMAGQPKTSGSQQDGDGSPHEPSDPSARARLLNPRSRSQLNLERMSKPEGMTPIQPPEKKRNKPMKWQFGIRSKNHAAEAMLAIFRALKAMGADWEVPKTRKPGEAGSTGPPSPEESRDEREDFSGSEEASDEDNNSGEDNTEQSGRSGNNSFNSSRGRGRSRYGSYNDWGYSVPEDPWIINARFRKGDLLPPGVLHANSAHSSRVDLSGDISTHGSGILTGRGNESTGSAGRRRSSILSSSSSSTSGPGDGSASSPNDGSATDLNKHATPPNTSSSANPSKQTTSSEPPANNTTVSSTTSNLVPGSKGVSATSLSSTANGGTSRSMMTMADDSAYIYLTIQLYAIEKETYLVDFKCAGYERVVRRLAHEIKENIDTDGDDQEARRNSNAGSESSEYDNENEDDEDNNKNNNNDDDDDGDETNNSQATFESGRPREGGMWDAMRAQNSNAGVDTKSIGRTDYAPGATDTTRSSSTTGSTLQRGRRRETRRDRNSKDRYVVTEDLIPRGRAADEKDVSSPFPFLDVASRLIIQLARAD